MVAMAASPGTRWAFPYGRPDPEGRAARRFCKACRNWAGAKAATCGSITVGAWVIHDHATVAQMRNCMSVGNLVAGVVCADGHLGYVQPVAGVIAVVRGSSIR